MTVTMSSEGDSSKSVLSESNEKSGTDHTDSSQDSHDVKSDTKAEKGATENDVEKKDNDEKPKDEKEEEGKSSDKKAVVDEKIHDTRNQSVSEETEKESVNKDKKEKKDKSKDDEEKSNKSDKDEEDDESEKEDKKEIPLLDQPLEKSGKRERKNVQRFNEDFNQDSKEVVKVEYDNGTGTPLGDIPRVDASISRFKNDDLKLLHRFLFKVPGKNTMIKKNIRKFNGFNFKKDSDEHAKKVAAAHKFEMKHLKSICEMLDLTKNGTKDEVIERIIDFLLDPKDSGKPVGGGRPKRTAAVRANNRGYSSHDDYSSDEKQSSRARRDKGKRLNLKDDSSSDEEFQPNQSDGSEEPPQAKRKRKNQKKESSGDEASDASVASSEESDDEPKSKRKKGTVKVDNKTKAKSTPGRRGRPPAPVKKTPSRGKKAKASSEEEEESDHKDDGSSSEDEPLVKKAKNTQPPTDEEIKTFIKGILEGANLEEITMKTVCQRVYGHYPDFDLTHKKDFIKSTVKSLIST